MATDLPSRRTLLKMVLLRFGSAFLVMSIMFFVPAGTLRYWQAWLYMAVLLVPMLGVLVWLVRNDPALLERRMHMRERGNGQKPEIVLSIIWLLIAFVVPGFDYRFGWSNVPVWLVLVADCIVLGGYGIFFLVLRENSYASRVVEVVEGQQVIDSGPYAVVRHPMYVGVLLMFVFSPLALGSYWAMLSSVLMVYLLVRRIHREEAMLAVELEGYPTYMRRVRYRMIPGVW
jgi:protein-S-isoprenylcysteine O-methyltransferase Ste14